MKQNVMTPIADRPFGRVLLGGQAPAPAPIAPRAGKQDPPTLAPTQAARQLALLRAEFELAVRLGRIHTVRGGGPGERRVARAEIDRVRTQPGFPDALREQVKTLGTSEAATLLGITAARFTRLARLGRLTPVLHYRNRYRAVVWRYLAEEVEEFAARPEHRALLTGRTPAPFKQQLDAGLDSRARNWRARCHESLLGLANGPWESAAVSAAFLNDEQIAHTVPDPDERARLHDLRPRRPATTTGNRYAASRSPDLTTAETEDEIRGYQAHLRRCLQSARERNPGCPDSDPPATHGPRPCRTPPATTAVGNSSGGCDAGSEPPRRTASSLGRQKGRTRRALGPLTTVRQP
ncbi:DUF6397 family protein [Streptomyces sp. NPDC059578]|uniref:DUF6397 family protein n=1 Tax=unclassified Streptomyces TaxID=2593676 RepID=UPI00365A4666